LRIYVVTRTKKTDVLLLDTVFKRFLFKGEGYGILMNIGLGILGGWLFGILGLGSGDGFIGLWNELAKNGHRPNYTKIVNN
jgi:hypothetical protein